MNFITNNITNYNISDDWGWYVDIEDNSYINSNIDIPYKDDFKSEEKDLNNICSTTLITTLLVYAIFFLI